MEVSLQIFAPIFVGIAAFFAYLFVKWGKKSWLMSQLEQLEHKQELAGLAVRMVQGLYKDLDGDAKYNKAVEWLSIQFNKHGLKTDEHEVKALIEAMLQKFKTDVSKLW